MNKLFPLFFQQSLVTKRGESVKEEEAVEGGANKSERENARGKISNEWGSTERPVIFLLFYYTYIHSSSSSSSPFPSPS